MNSFPAVTESTGWCRITFGRPGIAAVRSCSTLGFCAPTAAIEQPSQLMPASQKAWTSVIGPLSNVNRGRYRGAASTAAGLGDSAIAALPPNRKAPVCTFPQGQGQLPANGLYSGCCLRNRRSGRRAVAGSHQCSADAVGGGAGALRQERVVSRIEIFIPALQNRDLQRVLLNLLVENTEQFLTERPSISNEKGPDRIQCQSERSEPDNQPRPTDSFSRVRPIATPRALCGRNKSNALIVAQRLRRNAQQFCEFTYQHGDEKRAIPCPNLFRPSHSRQCRTSAATPKSVRFLPRSHGSPSHWARRERSRKEPCPPAPPPQAPRHAGPLR